MQTLDALLELLALDRLPRTGWLQVGVPAPESVGAHSQSVALVALALAPRVEPALSTDRAMALALVHDTPEAWLGDIPRRGAGLLPPGAKAQAETEAASQLLRPLSPAALERWEEYQQAETREARFARLCDRLAMGVRALGYAQAGFRRLDGFRSSLGELDCAEFPPCAELQASILAALDKALS